ncbi:histone-lysine N-methyltransferase SETMAR [Trichonephila inaurata madagascariensis]|uniref:Histone-lysine N-methyltransferase SETMAR n=1 Tax=Trichonephila inaurata madagascariensis TaxID=2747483 RepID=A0A8X7CS79_9ARAC|nr:histone-lysine N-methyltransferase SETMAR [Trichonephila inaurata madagascariensis]
MPVRLRVGRSVENIAAVETSVANDLNQSIPRRSQELGIAKTTLWQILRKDLTLHPYKIRLTQELKPMDHSKRRMFSDWALEKVRGLRSRDESASSFLIPTCSLSTSRDSRIGDIQLNHFELDSTVSPR